MQHLFGSPGKLLRPTLVFLSARFGPSRDREVVLNLAQSLELVHTASLVHDDIVDEAELRRNVATVNATWDDERKRFRADFFLDTVAKHGTHGCNYLLTANMEMDPLEGFKVASWDAGFGDFAMRPDLGSLRVLPWQPGAALVICDFAREDESLVAEAPRSVFRRQLDAIAKQGLTCYCASELEFYLFNQTYHSAFTGGYRASNPRRLPHGLSPHAADTRRSADARDSQGHGERARAGREQQRRVEPGTTRDQLHLCRAAAMADMHVLFKQGVKEIAEQHGKAVTFMAKYSPTEAGNSCHIHMSLWKSGKRTCSGTQTDEFQISNSGPKARRQNGKKSLHGGSKFFRQFLGGLMKDSPELCLFFGPTINSYKRYQPGSWAPTRMAWATDNRTTGFRIVGQGNGFRIENRCPALMRIHTGICRHARRRHGGREGTSRMWQRIQRERLH